MKNYLTTLPGQSFIQGHLEHILANTAVSTYWKDKQGKYLGVNEVFVKTADLASFEDIIGISDRDLIWGEEEALLMQQNDSQVAYTGKSSTVVETAASYHDRKFRYFLSVKTPLLSHTGKVIGVFGVSYLLDGSQSTSMEIKNAGFPLEFIMLNNLQCLPDESNYNLTPRLLDCLYYLVKGFTIKEIAKALQLSPRTVEHYIDSVKIKLNCLNRIELIEKAYKLKSIRSRLLKLLGNTQ